MNNPASQFKPLVEEINQRYLQLHSLSNDELRFAFQRVVSVINKMDNTNEALNSNLKEVYAIIKETTRRFALGNIVVTANQNDRILASLEYDFVYIDNEKACYKKTWNVGGESFSWNMIPYDEQILGGILLHYGYAVEMATGEGKTLVSIFPTVLNALSGNGVHIMTANDYLSKRDFELNSPIYFFLGLTASCIENFRRGNTSRKKAYQADITFGANSSFIFDYLFDHIAKSPEEILQSKHNFAIIDELDSILIDDAQTPHIISQQNNKNDKEQYKKYYPIIQEMIAGEFCPPLFVSTRLNKETEITPEGEEWLSQKIGIPNLYAIKRTYEVTDFDSLSKQEQEEIHYRISLQNILQQLLLALTVYERDVDYIDNGGKISIVSQNTGRIQESHRWEHGLHTAIETKEQVNVEEDNDAVAVISVKNYFKLYQKVAGMSGTIMSVQKELAETYHLKSAPIPTHQPVIRKDMALQVYHTCKEKDAAIAELVISNQRKGRPTLIGCPTLKRSDQIATVLSDYNLDFNRLDARTVKSEAELVAKAGIGNTITLSTSIAGRGTDIKPSEDVLAKGGLLVIGTELFDSERIDLQLKGRSGRQGNPGSSVFFASLEDEIIEYLSSSDKKELFKIGEITKQIDDLSRLAAPFFAKAQRKREALSQEKRNATARKDDIIAPHRYKYYKLRNQLLLNPSALNELLCSILNKSLADLEEFEAQIPHISTLYKSIKVLIKKHFSTTLCVDFPIPFTENLEPFAITVDPTKTLQDFSYFSNEFKRQIVLQTFDMRWTEFITYMMGPLDMYEISLLNDKYRIMIENANQSIYNRLTKAILLYCPRRTDEVWDRQSTSSSPRPNMPQISLNTPCPCGSGKKFYECHGKDTRRIHRRR